MTWNEDGYRQAKLPISAWGYALRNINRAFRDEGYDSARYDEYSYRTFFPKLAASRILFDLGRTVAGYLAIPTEYQFDGSQIALRFPAEEEGVNPHVDGVPTGENGVIPGEPTRCDAIAGIYLSPVMEGDGCLRLWPGSQKLVEKFIKERGRKLLGQGVLPEFDKLKETSIEGGAGHAFVFHPHMIHGTTANKGLGIRYAVYWRFYDPKGSKGP